MTLPTAEAVEAWVTFLEESAPSPLRSTAELNDALEKTRHARRALRELDEKRLVVGFLGGTGVGKSTLLNAIAGMPISQSGDRRPTTDRIVCYRHSDFPVPKFLTDDDLAAPPPPHDIDALRGVTLLDLPDIDSRKTAHRDRVHRTLPHLDLLVIVTSVDKYADRLLYDELRDLPQPPENTIIILNAIDRLPEADLAAVAADFADKLTLHANWVETPIHPTSAKLAGEEPNAPGRHGLTTILDLMEELGGDERRRAVLAANAQSHLARAHAAIDLALPTKELDRWMAAIDALPTGVPTPSHSLVATFSQDLEEAIGPWVRDRALRASSFPIGWMHFLFRRFRRKSRGRVRDPFRTGHDPGQPYAEEMLHRPLRIAHHEAEQILRRETERFSIDLPALPVPSDRPSGSALEKWSEKLRKRAPKLGSKIRHHVLPLFALLATLGWLVAPAFRGQDGWVAATWDKVWATVERFSPTQWGIVAIVLLVYYLLCYPYLLYRLEARIEAEAERGVRHYMDHFDEEYRRAWGGPLASRVTGLRQWWQKYRKLLSAAGGTAAGK
ncbi:MAG: GTPase [Planctomycetota bacterium]